MAESRGAQEDRKLKEAYRVFYENGDTFLRKSIAQSTLTSREIKIKKKEANIAGLQLADLLANPLTRDVLHAYGKIVRQRNEFTDKLMEAVWPKYNCHQWNGRVQGYGQKLLE